MSDGEFILYTTDDGKAEVQLRVNNGTAWLSLNQIADLFDRDKSVISRHIKNVFEDGELTSEAVVARYATTALDRKTYQVDHYRLEMVLAVGYRVQSERGVQFRRWATSALKEYLVKGFVMNDKRLKDPKFDYFDELLERIRDIRSSEARLYQKVRDILALSVDYNAKSDSVPTFYATIQNKMLYAVTQHTAAELIATRANENAPNMGLTTWKGGRVRKADVMTAKNYLGEPEIKELNLIVGMFLDTAELRAKRRQEIRLAEWEPILDGFLKSNELPLLRDAGQISAKHAETIAHDRYALFDAKRKETERLMSEEMDELDELKRIANVAETARRKRPVPTKKGDKR
ncbi:putative DNA-binding protein [Azospirillaceae bacterium]